MIEHVVMDYEGEPVNIGIRKLFSSRTMKKTPASILIFTLAVVAATWTAIPNGKTAHGKEEFL